MRQSLLCVLSLTYDCECHLFLLSPKADQITILAAYQGQVAEIERLYKKFKTLEEVQVTQFYLIMHMVGQVPLSRYHTAPIYCSRLCCGSGSGIGCLFDPWIRDGRKSASGSYFFRS
jgi:hypothetical protein